jgi:glycosyltransferase involved in cell wall biosynthesis
MDVRVEKVVERRLLIVANVAWFFAMHRLPIARMARTRGLDVHVACGIGSGAEDVIAENFPFHAVPLRREAFTPFSDVRATAALTGLYRRLRPALVHHVTLKPVLYGSVAARLAGVPAVLNAFAGLGSAFAGTSQAAQLRQRLIVAGLAASTPRRRHVVLFENHDDRELLVGRGAVRAEHAEVIAGIGVDTSHFEVRPPPAEPVNVLFASRMLKEKGAEYFVEAARILRAQGVPVTCTMVGTPDTTNPGSLSVEQLESWDREGVVRWLGFRRAMPDVIAAAHLVCLPTYYREGVPRILLEAAACGRALIATDMPGCRDIVRHGVNGLRVPPHDVGAIVNAIRELSADPARRCAMGAAGREIVEREFELSIVLDRTWHLYQRLLDALPEGRTG